MTLWNPCDDVSNTQPLQASTNIAPTTSQTNQSDIFFENEGEKGTTGSKWSNACTWADMKSTHPKEAWGAKCASFPFRGQTKMPSMVHYGWGINGQ